ncbi:putative reverse transcriptase domain-containing protein, partial [Tanacetum coccineum]
LSPDLGFYTPESIQAMIDHALLRNSTNGDGSHSSHGDNRRNVQTASPCFYADFIKCQPLNFKGTEGVVGLTQWIEKMDSVFNISGCAIENQEVLKKKMTDKYCPRGKIKKLEIELWNLKVKGNDVPAYTERFQELTLICTKFVANEIEKVDKYINGLPDNIYGKNSAPTRKGNLTTKGRLMIHPETTMVTNSNPSKGRMSPKSTTWGRAKGSLMGDPCPSATSAINKVGHFARDCRNTSNTNVANTQKGNGATPKGNGCFECGAS